MERDEPTASSWLDLMPDASGDYFDLYFHNNGKENPMSYMDQFDRMDDELQMEKQQEFRFPMDNSMGSRQCSNRRSRGSSRGSGCGHAMDDELLDTQSCSLRKDSSTSRHDALANELAYAAESQDGCVESSVTPGRSMLGKENVRRNQRMEMTRKKPWLSKEERIYCNCEKTKCLKMYCTCFRNGVACGHGCRCKNCSNKADCHEARKVSRGEQCQKEAAVMQENTSEVFCNCRTSFCEKSYCACARTKNGCSARCKCFHCKNSFGSRSQPSGMAVDCF